MRVLQLILGTGLMVHALYNQEWMLAIICGLFTLSPLLNLGCCSNQCSVPAPLDKSPEKYEEITFKEVKS